MLCEYLFRLRGNIACKSFRFFSTIQNGLPGSYYGVDHPYISKNNNTTMYGCMHEMKDFELRAVDGLENVNETSMIVIEDVTSPARLRMHSVSRVMNEQVFFYNENNPHLGMLVNIKQTLYDFFEMVGPVKNSWYRILVADVILFDLIRLHWRKAEGNGGYSCCSVANVLSIIEGLESKKGVSFCKYNKSVKRNLLQLKRTALTGPELTTLQVLAQYAYYKYEII